jgi:cullin-4
MELFRQHILYNRDLQQSLLQGILAAIEHDRSDFGNSIGTLETTVRSLLRMYADLQCYEEFFEPKFLAASELYYRRESNRCVQSMETAEYLEHAEQRLQLEEQRALVNWQLQSSTRQPLIAAVEREMIFAHKQTLLDGGCERMLRAKQLADLARMFRLFARVDALESMRIALANYIKVRQVN